MEREEIENIIGEDNSETIDIKNNIISMIFTDLYYELGAPSLDKLDPFDLAEDEFTNPTRDSIIKIKKYADSLNIIKSR